MRTSTWATNCGRRFKPRRHQKNSLKVRKRKTDTKAVEKVAFKYFIFDYCKNAQDHFIAAFWSAAAINLLHIDWLILSETFIFSELLRQKFLLIWNK